MNGGHAGRGSVRAQALCKSGSSGDRNRWVSSCLHLAHHPSALHSWLLWELPEILSLEPKGKEEEREEKEEVESLRT